MSRNHQKIKNDPRWKAARLACLERDDHACVVCGSEEQLEVDHIIELHEDNSLAFELENLQTLCRAHHIEKTRAKPGVVRNTWVNPNYPELIDLAF